MDGVGTMKLPLLLNITQEPEIGREKLKDKIKEHLLPI